MLRTKAQYIEALGKMKRNLYFDGEKIDRTDEVQMACIDTIGTTYDEAQNPDPKVQELMLAKSHLTGET
ncbi:MAG: aromatic ring hydroxylase, partial [Syntrophales bacterium]|nr:aromatic ring hydroxylase [Syntrophales bacterium]